MTTLPRLPHPTALAGLLAALVLLGASFFGLPSITTSTQAADELPVVYLDAIDEARWSVSELSVAPGQTIRITNRGVTSHTVVIPDWGVRIEISAFQSADVVAPNTVAPGETYEFYCDVADHAQRGQSGTIEIVTADEARGIRRPGQPVSPSSPGVTLDMRDDLTWSTGELSLAPGQILQVRNTGVIEHHFVVDEWGINETVSAGEVRLVLVPPELEPGETFTFYCSIPGHRAAGMSGTITIVEGTDALPALGGPGSAAAMRTADVEQFVPDVAMFGEGWSEVRAGNVRSIVPQWSQINVTVFPGDGIGVVFVGPSGSRAAVAVLPLQTSAIPTNQVDKAIDDMQFALMDEWNANSTSSVNLSNVPPPPGCSKVQRAIGIAGMNTLPAGMTVCQVRNANVAIFVTVEGEVGGRTGPEASDWVVTTLLDKFGS